jgi:methylglyoxal synthase
LANGFVANRPDLDTRSTCDAFKVRSGMNNGDLGSRTTVALIAHDSRKKDLIAFSIRHRVTLSRYRLIATANTGKRLNVALGRGVECKLSGPLGGDAQIAAEVASGLVYAVFFLVDPLSAVPHGADIQCLLRLCDVHDVAVATNLGTAELVMCGLEALPAKASELHEMRRAGALEGAPKSRPRAAASRLDA